MRGYNDTVPLPQGSRRRNIPDRIPGAAGLKSFDIVIANIYPRYLATYLAL